MESQKNVDQDEPATRSSPLDNEPHRKEDSESDIDEEEMKKWLSTAYERGSFNPMKEPLKAPWDLPISNSDVEKLKVGFKAHSMDERWHLLMEDPDENGKMSLHIIRSWCREECYILHILPEPSNNRIESITWEGNKAGLQCDAEQAKKEAVMVSRWILKCEFEALPYYPSSMFWASSAYKKLDAK